MRCVGKPQIVGNSRGSSNRKVLGMEMYKLAVLVSGSGTILEAMIDAGVDIALVGTDRECRGRSIAIDHGIPTLSLDRSGYGWDSSRSWHDQPDFDRDRFSREFAYELDKKDITLVAMAGFMTIFSEPFFDRYRGHVLNTHPALLPHFKGAHAVRDALAAGVKETGCTLHIATEEVDEGPILEQATVAILPNDTEESLQERIKVHEREIYPRVLKELLSGKRELPPLS